MTPLETVNLRMKSYNDHDLESFLALYSQNIEIYTYPDVLLGKGKDHLKNIFAPMFNQKSVDVKIHHQIAKDSYVVNHETVSYEDSKVEYISIYEVKDGLIQSVRFVRD